MVRSSLFKDSESEPGLVLVRRIFVTWVKAELSSFSAQTKRMPLWYKWCFHGNHCSCVWADPTLKSVILAGSALSVAFGKKGRICQDSSGRQGPGDGICTMTAGRAAFLFHVIEYTVSFLPELPYQCVVVGLIKRYLKSKFTTTKNTEIQLVTNNWFGLVAILVFVSNWNY